MTDLKDITQNGTTLYVTIDTEKTPMFVLKNGSWEPTEIGGAVEPATLQAYLDANELSVGEVIDVPSGESASDAPSDEPVRITATSVTEYRQFLKDVDPGTQLVHGETTYTKDAEGKWLLSSGLVAQPDHLYFLKSNVAITAGEVPTVAPVTEVPTITAGTITAEDLKANEIKADHIPAGKISSDQIADVVLDEEDLPENSLSEEELEQLTEGDLVSYSSPSLGVVQFSRLADGSWESEATGGIYSTHLLVSASSDGKLFLSDDTPTVEVGTKHYPESAVRVALTALESHSGFQVAYALKPINSPLLEQDLVNLAKTEFPDAATTKFAVISMLKSKLGIEEPKDTSPVVHIAGKEELAFTQKQVEDAIDILENYQGKLFRNELVTKGSPIAALSANELVGFHKDKLEGKQAFIELLRGSLQN